MSVLIAQLPTQTLSDQRETQVAKRKFDPAKILETLDGEGVDYVVIGGIAAALHGSSIGTYDIDICYRRRMDNIGHLVNALKRLGAHLRVAKDPDADQIPFVLDTRAIQKGGNFSFTTNYGPLDCIAWPDGVSGYDELVSGASEYDIEDLKIKVASVDALLDMKRKAGREKDLISMFELEEIKRLKANS